MRAAQSQSLSQPHHAPGAQRAARSAQQSRWAGGRAWRAGYAGVTGVAAAAAGSMSANASACATRPSEHVGGGWRAHRHTLRCARARRGVRGMYGSSNTKGVPHYLRGRAQWHALGARGGRGGAPRAWKRSPRARRRARSRRYARPETAGAACARAVRGGGHAPRALHGAMVLGGVLRRSRMRARRLCVGGGAGDSLQSVALVL